MKKKARALLLALALCLLVVFRVVGFVPVLLCVAAVVLAATAVDQAVRWLKEPYRLRQENLIELPSDLAV